MIGFSKGKKSPETCYFRALLILCLEIVTAIVAVIDPLVSGEPFSALPDVALAH